MILRFIGVIHTLTESMPILWEAFQHETAEPPTYLLHMDAHPDRLGLEVYSRTHLRLMPEYQGVEITQLQLQALNLIFFLVPAKSTAITMEPHSASRR